MASVSEQLRKLYSPEALQELERIRGTMISDPTVFDNHSRELRAPATEEKKDGEV